MMRASDLTASPEVAHEGRSRLRRRAAGGAPDVALVAPFPPPGERHGGWTGVASYAANLAGALGDAGARVTVIAPREPGLPAVVREGPVEVRRSWRRGPGALPAAVAAARSTGAPAVHLQHELFLYGGPAAAPGIVPALAALRAERRGAVVTMHHVVAPAAVDRHFVRTHGVRAPAPVARAAVAGLQHAVGALADRVVVHEPSFAGVVPGATVVPHGIEAPTVATRAAARAALGVDRDATLALCFGFVAPYKGLETALDAARLAGVELVVAGGPHPRHDRAYADALQATAPPGVRFTGFVPDADVGRWFAAADVALLLYPRPFASSGPLALALAHRTPVLMSEALAATTGAPPGLAVPRGSAALAERLRELAADPAAGALLRERAATMAAGRGWPDVARRHLELYEGVPA
jgi:glycosyltransferase involved in cell wall biosynthesis